MAAYRLPPSRSTLERIAKRVARAAVENAGRVEAQLRLADTVPDKAVAIVMGLDRTSVAMVEVVPRTRP